MFKKTTVIFVFFFAIYSTDAFAILKNYFKNAREAEKAENYDEALSIYYKVLEQYPSETKSALRAYDHILNIYKIRKEDYKIKEVLTYLKNAYPNDLFDLRDIEKLSLIYSDNGETNEALKLRTKIINEPYSPIYIKTMLRTYARLLKYYKNKKDENQISKLLLRLNSLSSKDFDENDIYKYAMLYLKYGKKTEALKIMTEIIQMHPNTLSSRKALFILAEEAQKIKDYDSAIQYYSIYIERYPTKTFYVQKAYQRLVDCYIAMGDRSLSEELMKQVADWVNGVSNYHSQLNLAIDLKFKHMDKLAEVTFYTGYDDAIRVIEKNPGSYDALRAYLDIQRAAHAIGRYDIVEHAAIATLRDFNDLKGNAELDKNVSFIKSQAYLWLAKIYSEYKRDDDTIRILEVFIQLYPEHKDKDYALYELGRSYENKGMKGKATELYMMVTSEPLKSMAEKKLSELK